MQISSGQFNYKFSTSKKKPKKLKIIYQDGSTIIGREIYKGEFLSQLIYYKKNKTIVFSIPLTNQSYTFRCKKQIYK